MAAGVLSDSSVTRRASSLQDKSTPHSDATSEQTRSMRAHAWRYIFDCYAKKEAAPETAPEDAKEGFKNDSRAKDSIHK
jgi:hypothetical protein